MRWLRGYWAVQWLARLLSFYVGFLAMQLITGGFNELKARTAYDAVTYCTRLFVLVFLLFLLIVVPYYLIVSWMTRNVPFSRWKKDLGFAAVFLILCAFWLFGPRPAGFSFGDNIGEIIRQGRLTAYGFDVQFRSFLNCVGVCGVYLALQAIFNRVLFRG